MATTEEARTSGVSGRVAGIVTAIGGVLMVVGSLLAFVTVEADVGFGPQSQTVSGLDTDDGKLFLGVGIGLVVIGLVILAVNSTVVRRIFGILGVLVSGFMLYAAIVDIITISDELPPGVTASAGIGLYVVLAGGVVGLIGSGMGLFSRPTEPAPVAPPPPPGAEPAGEPPPPPPEG